MNSHCNVSFKDVYSMEYLIISCMHKCYCLLKNSPILCFSLSHYAINDISEDMFAGKQPLSVY